MAKETWYEVFLDDKPIGTTLDTFYDLGDARAYKETYQRDHPEADLSIGQWELLEGSADADFVKEVE